MCAATDPQPQTSIGVRPGGVRNTRQRSAVGDLLGELDGFHSAQDLHAMLRDRGHRIGLATVYRTLQGLASAGDIDVMRPPTGEYLYRRCSSGHHHHLVCRCCGSAVEVLGPGVERWASSVADAHGYTDVSHTLEIFGTCRDCSGCQPAGRHVHPNDQR